MRYGLLSKLPLSLLLVLSSSVLSSGDQTQFSLFSSTTMTTIKESSGSFGLASGSFHWKYGFARSSNQIIKRAQAIQHGQLYVDSAILEPFLTNLSAIDWNVTFTDSPGTFSLYLLALNPVAYLTQAYELTGEESYLDTARGIVEQWLTYKETEESKKNPYLWHDHGTAIRTNNLIQFLLANDKKCCGGVERDRRFCLDVMEALQEHVIHLSNKSEYTSKHNHGIFQDQALIHLAYFLNSPDSKQWLELAKSRLKEQKEHAFNDEMVHVENSPGYQIGVVNLLKQIADFLVKQNDGYGKILQADLVGSLEFMAWAVKPNGLLAEIGDTLSVKDQRARCDPTCTRQIKFVLIF